ncbi:hypothetical protein SOASR032_28960 [Pragia fontium]|uniref:Uncharacterized protein n=1 Tax=Pragia fontium TaxID=82985 RepID=A0ABQ5LN80_9GAMM|nr:hypothetical protein SOASR032_28960 [Pragia fontium]
MTFSWQGEKRAHWLGTGHHIHSESVSAQEMSPIGRCPTFEGREDGKKKKE